MTINQMAKNQVFDINKLLGDTGKTTNKRVSSSSAGVSFAQPNWEIVPTKGGTTRSQESLEKAIVELAQKEAAGGVLAATKERTALMKEYMSLVSPDRKSAFAKYDGKSGFVSGAVMNAFGGRELMIYSSVDRTWSTMPTKNELDMYSRFNEIYTNAYTAYEEVHGKVVGTPKVTSASFNFTV